MATLEYKKKNILYFFIGAVLNIIMLFGLKMNMINAFAVIFILGIFKELFDVIIECRQNKVGNLEDFAMLIMSCLFFIAMEILINGASNGGQATIS